MLSSGQIGKFRLGCCQLNKHLRQIVGVITQSKVVDRLFSEFARFFKPIQVKVTLDNFAVHPRRKRRSRLWKKVIAYSIKSFKRASIVALGLIDVSQINIG